MLCPIDQTQLVMTERQGVEIDYCPKCRGIWLDRGELDKILDRAAAEAPARPVSEPDRTYERPREYRDRDDDDDRRHYGHHQHKRKKSFLSDILDF
jgi:Zn-finger nucleic acid-binding protein